MNSQEFMNEVEHSHERSVKVLWEKEKEYAGKEDRLEQFHLSAIEQGINPCRALIGMSSKHSTSIATMAKDPYAYSLEQWNEKITDLRNYTFLLDALIRDLGIK